MLKNSFDITNFTRYNENSLQVLHMKMVKKKFINLKNTAKISELLRNGKPNLRRFVDVMNVNPPSEIGVFTYKCEYPLGTALSYRGYARF